MLDKQLVAQAQNWFDLAARLKWRSFDPFDLLLSPYLGNVRTLSPLAARVVIQFGKRCGASARRVLGMHPHEEAKTLSDYLGAAALLSRSGDTWAGAYLRELTARLLAKAVPTPHGLGWGLEFPYATRFINVPARTPNVYQTTNAVQALLMAHENSGDASCLEHAVEGCRFIIEGLGTFECGKSTWFRYWPALDAPIVNVQASVAGLFAHLGSLVADETYRELSDCAIDTVLGAQREGGSWPYSTDGKANFVDGFHTGFILQGLGEYVTHRSGDKARRASETLRRGFDFFKKRLISSAGMPLGFAGGRGSLDGQNFAQCVQTFALCGQSAEDLRAGLQAWQEMLKIPALNRTANCELRWTYGPAVLATAHLYAAISQLGGEGLE